MEYVIIRCFKNSTYNDNYVDIKFPIKFKSMFEVDMYSKFHILWEELTCQFEILLFDTYRYFMIGEGKTILGRTPEAKYYLQMN